MRRRQGSPTALKRQASSSNDFVETFTGGQHCCIDTFRCYHRHRSTSIWNICAVCLADLSTSCSQNARNFLSFPQGPSCLLCCRGGDPYETARCCTNCLRSGA